MEKKFQFPQMIMLHRSVREAAYDPEQPYHCTHKACCYDGK